MTESQGISDGAWNTTARSGPGPAISRPASTIPPLEMSLRPAMMAFRIVSSPSGLLMA